MEKKHAQPMLSESGSSVPGETTYGSISVHHEPIAQVTRQVTPRQVWVAYIVCIVSMVLHCISLVCVQVLGGAIPEFELNAWRFVVQAVLVFPVIIGRKCDLKVPKRRLLLLFAMFVAYNACNVVFFASALYIAVGTVSGMASSITIAGNAILSICIKSERKLQLYLGAVFAIAGLLLMTQPDFLFRGDRVPPPPIVNFTSPCVGHGIESSKVEGKNWLGYVFVGSAGLLDCCIYHGMSNLVKDVNSFTFSFWNAFVGTVVSLVLMGILETPVMPTDPMCVLLLIGHAIGTSQISIVLPWCLKYLSPSVATMVNSLQLVLLLILQYTVLKHINPGNGNWVEIFGAVVLFVGVVVGPTWHLIKENRGDHDKGEKINNHDIF